ncbi:hypothetical protein LAZ67_8000419 [Cordylochernes scorpioides]|uniref:Uncharacterized protein n=1 Tax=Cordylochernes scorpioides TaxID=51811 RepID=A0ABY6KPX2_9ARAC|nr:hypothetical protein LAZ67_8000419 [Cordylochernes scorpioides]
MFGEEERSYVVDSKQTLLSQEMTDRMIRCAVLAVLLSFVAGSTPLLERRFNACRVQRRSAQALFCPDARSLLFWSRGGKNPWNLKGREERFPRSQIRGSV